MLEFIQNISTVNAPLYIKKKKKKVQSVLYCPQTEKTSVWQLMVNKFGLIHVFMFFTLLSHSVLIPPLNK